MASRPRDDAAARHTIIYAAPAGSPGPGTRRLDLRPYRVIDKAMARALGASLDRQLAAGREPEESRLLAARAQDIVALRRREQLARYWERVLAAATRPAPALRNSVPLRRGPVMAAEPAITELASLLRAQLPVSARGVAMARMLLTDAGGPLYWSAAPESLHVALRAAITRLDPESPFFPGVHTNPPDPPPPRGAARRSSLAGRPRGTRAGPPRLARTLEAPLAGSLRLACLRPDARASRPGTPPG